MQNRNITVSLILALVATFMVYAYMDSAREKFKRENGEDVSVLVAAANIKELDIITPEMLEYKPIPAKFVQPFDSKNYKQLNKDNIAGFVAKIPILKGEQITFNKISNIGSRTGLSRQVTPGKRAYAIPINTQTGVSKMLKPGDRVDVMAFIRIPRKGQEDHKEVRTILQDVLILSLGTYVSSDVPKGIQIDDVKGKTEMNLSTFTGYTTVSLEIDPQEALKLTYLLGNSNSSKSLFLSLRNNSDKRREDLGNMTLEDVLNVPKRGRGVAGEQE